MQQSVPFLPEQASTIASQVDHLYLFLNLLTAFFTLLIAGLIIVFSILYRRRSAVQRSAAISGYLPLELGWIVIPMALMAIPFFWGASIYFTAARVPENALDIYVVGKQWMWKFQHQGGQREINQLHVPMGQAVRLTMTSQDVIHSFFVPAFRMKADLLPGSYVSTWFQATKTGHFHLFCAEYCGTNHSRMIGEVIVMTSQDYQAWLASSGTEGSLAADGEKLFGQFKCNSCHRNDAQARAPNLAGLFGREVLLDDGRRIIANEGYVRESILNPDNKVVAGFEKIMPNYTNLINEDQLLQLIAYIKSLESKPPSAPFVVSGAPSEPPNNKKTTEPR